MNPLMNPSRLRRCAGYLGVAALAAVLGWSGAAKLADIEAFAAAVTGFRLAGGAVARGVAYYVPWLELVLAAGVLLPRWRAGALLVAAWLFTGFAGLWAITWLRGLEVACGCFGGSEEVLTGWALARAGVLAVAAWVTWREMRRAPGRPEHFN